MDISYSKGIFINKAVVAKVNGTKYDAQSTNIFAAGSEYVMYFSEVTGFTEDHPYGAPAAFVDYKGSIKVYDSSNSVVFSEPNVFSSYLGGMPLEDSKYITLRMKLGPMFKAGKYRWESAVTDNKDSSKWLKGVVNFTIN